MLKLSTAVCHTNGTGVWIVASEDNVPHASLAHLSDEERVRNPAISAKPTGWRLSLTGVALRYLLAAAISGLGRLKSDWLSDPAESRCAVTLAPASQPSISACRTRRGSRQLRFLAKGRLAWTSQRRASILSSLLRRSSSVQALAGDLRSIRRRNKTKSFWAMDQRRSVHQGYMAWPGRGRRPGSTFAYGLGRSFARPSVEYR